MSTQQSLSDNEPLVDVTHITDCIASLVEQHQQQEQHEQKLSNTTLLQFRSHLAQILNAADANKDGKLSRHEFIQARSNVIQNPPDGPVLIDVGTVDETEAPLTLDVQYLSTASAAPVLLIPGLCGSQLKNENNGTVWINVWPWWFLNDGLKTDWNGTDVFSVKDTTARDGLPGVNYLDNLNLLIPYMYKLSKFLQGSGVDAVPYDFRMVPHAKEVNDWVTRAKLAVERLYASKQNRKVYLIAHSLGNFMTTHLLHTERDWADKYIAGYIAVCPPFGGAGTAVEALVQGVTLFVVPLIGYHVTIPASYLRPHPSISWLLPNSYAFKDQVVLKYQGQNYTPDTLTNFMKAAGDDLLSKTLPIHEKVVKDQVDLQSKRPNVPVWLVTAKTRRTAIGFDADSKTYIYEDGPNVGDRTVPYASLHACDDAWQIPEENKNEIQGNINNRGDPINHVNIISSEQFLKYIGKIISQ